MLTCPRSACLHRSLGVPRRTEGSRVYIICELTHELHQFLNVQRSQLAKIARRIRSRALSTRSVMALPFGVMVASQTRRSAGLRWRSISPRLSSFATWRLMLPMFIIVSLDAASSGAVLPILPFFLRDMSASPLVLGLVLGAEALCQFVVASFLGQLSDRFGRKQVLLTSQAGVLIGSQRLPLPSCASVPVWPWLVLPSSRRPPCMRRSSVMVLSWDRSSRSLQGRKSLRRL